MTGGLHQIAARFLDLVRGGALDLPDPGSGRTAQRWQALFDWGREDVALARLIEAHVDAVSICHEAGTVARPGAAYGVWAAEDPTAGLTLDVAADGSAVLSGTKAFCSGAGIVDRALVTVPGPDGVVLVDVDVRPRPAVTVDASGWITAAFASTSTARVTFDDVTIAAGDMVGPPGWYLDRPGFWDGACGPAACWAGGAAGLADAVAQAASDATPNPHRDAHLGAVTALTWQMGAVLDRSGHQIDEAIRGHSGEGSAAVDTDGGAAGDGADGSAGPGGSDGMIRALSVRHVIERACTEIVDRVGRAMGPRPFAFDEAVSRRLGEVTVYIRQCHAERDLEALGRAVRGRADRPSDPAGPR